MTPMYDLNLLRILVAVVDSGSVTSAAGKLNMSQPTVSQALSRLRDITGDQLFIRDAQRMTPTAHAMRLYNECGAAIVKLEEALRSDTPFNPATDPAHFTIAMSDLGEMTFLPLLIDRLSQVAPHVNLDIVPMDVAEVDTMLKQRRIDFAIGKIASNDPEISSRDLFDETYAAIFRADHPVIQQELTLETFLACGHVVATDASGHWQASSMTTIAGIEQANVQVNLQHFTALPFAVSASDLVAVVPSSTAASFADRWALRWLPLPFEMPEFTVRMLWNSGKTVRAADHDWMIQTISDVLTDLGPYATRLGKT